MKSVHFVILLIVLIWSKKQYLLRIEGMKHTTVSLMLARMDTLISFVQKIFTVTVF